MRGPNGSCLTTQSCFGSFQNPWLYFQSLGSVTIILSFQQPVFYFFNLNQLIGFLFPHNEIFSEPSRRTCASPGMLRDSEPHCKHRHIRICQDSFLTRSCGTLGKSLSCYEPHAFQFYKWGGSKSNNGAFFSCLKAVIYLAFLQNTMHILFLIILNGKLSSMPETNTPVHFPKAELNHL